MFILCTSIVTKIHGSIVNIPPAVFITRQSCIGKIYTTIVNIPPIISAFVSLSDIYQDKTGVLLGPNGDPSFAERLKEIIWPLITCLFVSFEGYNSYETDLLAEFYLSGIIAMVNKWNRDSVLSLDELIKLVLPVVFPPDMTKTDSAN